MIEYLLLHSDARFAAELIVAIMATYAVIGPVILFLNWKEGHRRRS